MKTLYVIELDGVPIEVTTHWSRAQVLATERKVPGKRLRIEVVRHWYYEDENADIQLNFDEDTNPQLSLPFMEVIDGPRTDSKPDPQGSCAASPKSDCGCSDSPTGFSHRCG